MKAHTQEKAHPLENERGQSLVEMALILPFLLILVVGIVEAGVALNRQLTVVNAAREGARFGAFGATAGDIYQETKDATSGMFDFTEENAMIAVINATTNDAGTDFTEWITHTYPITAPVPYVTQGQVLAELQKGIAQADWPTKVGNVKIVVVDVRYNHKSVLGLPFVGAMANQIPIGSWTVMRLAAPRVGQLACCALPIALDTATVNWNGGGWEDGHLMDDIQVGTEPSQYGWLFWDPDSQPSEANLSASLQNRCNAWQQFADACDHEDIGLTPDSWISGATGWMAAAEGDVAALITNPPTYVAVPIWDRWGNCGDLQAEGCNCAPPGRDLYHIVGFALVEITEVDLHGAQADRHISARFRGWWDGCNE